ncbi:MAG: hypothetical protein ACOCQE_02815, partial [Halanaerobium sp.]
MIGKNNDHDLKTQGNAKKEKITRQAEKNIGDGFKNAESTEERIKLLVNKLKKLNEVQARTGSSIFRNRK